MFRWFNYLPWQEDPSHPPSWRLQFGCWWREGNAKPQLHPPNLPFLKKKPLNSDFPLKYSPQLIRKHWLSQLRKAIAMYAYFQPQNNNTIKYNKIISTLYWIPIMKSFIDIFSNPAINSTRQKKLFTFFQIQKLKLATIWLFWVIADWSQD